MGPIKAILEILFELIKKFAVWGFVLFLIFLSHGLRMPPGWLPASQQNQSFTEWASTLVNASIYWAWDDGLKIGREIFDRWNGMKNPIIKLGVLFMSVLLTHGFRHLLKDKLLQKKLAVYCPVSSCHKSSSPIPGSVNRYRCPDGHQFSGVVHDFHHI